MRQRSSGRGSCPEGHNQSSEERQPKAASISDQLKQGSGGKGTNLVAVVKGHNELLEEPASQGLRQATPAVDQLMQVPPSHILHHDRQVLSCEEALPEADDMWVTAERTQDLHDRAAECCVAQCLEQ